jgi:hypothetical protein
MCLSFGAKCDVRSVATSARKVSFVSVFSLLTMSMREYSSLLKEMGGSNGATGNDSYQVEHLFIFGVAEKWDKVVLTAVQGALSASREAVACARILTAAASLALVLWGTSCVIKSLKGNGGTGNGSSSSSAGTESSKGNA